MKRTILSHVIFVVLACSLQVACSDSSDDDSSGTAVRIEQINEATSTNKVFKVKVAWVQSELKAGNDTSHEAHVTLTNYDATVPATATLDEFTLTMPAHGHGTNKDDQVIGAHGAAMPSHFKVSGVHFSMAASEGMWQATISASVDGKSDIAVVKVSQVK